MDIQHQPAQMRFVAIENGQELGFCSYVPSREGWSINHTIVKPEAQGKGVARQLVEAAMREADSEGQPLEATCSYAVKILRESGRL